jgi:hypothetical protein
MRVITVEEAKSLETEARYGRGHAVRPLYAAILRPMPKRWWLNSTNLTLFNEAVDPQSLLPLLER